MLGVLPFQNISGDPQQEYFSDGLTEETITDLGQLNPEQLGVIARTSAMAYKSTKKTATEIGHELGVDYLLEGSVRRDSGSVRISAQLIRVEDGSHIWARNYQRDVKNILQAQIELGDAIAQQVQVRLPESLRRQQGKAFTLNPDAYDLYLRGRDQWYQRTPEAMQKSIAYFQQAIDRDPKFAMAYVGLADAYNISQVVGLPGIPRRPGEIYPRAKAAALMALKLDPQLGEAHTALAFEETHFDFDWQSAEKEFLRGIELNPSSAYAHLFYSNCYLSPMGRHKQAIAEMKKALALDPLSLAINNFLGNTYFYAGQDDLAVEQFHKTIEMNPGFVLAHYYLADVLARLERFDESISEFEKAEVLSKQNPELAALEAASMRRALASGGRIGYWREVLRREKKEMQAAPGASYAYAFASIYAELGDKDQVFAWLEKSYEARDGGALVELNVEPEFNYLHSDPRFQHLLNEIGLTH